jgi:hypothetical protein
MHVKVAILFVVSVIILATLPGCARIIDWTRSNFYQGEPVNDHLDIAKTYVRSITLYDEFSTLGNFDVLWLSDVVRSAYVNLHVFKRGEDQTYYKQVQQQNTFENSQFISFYVLSASSLNGVDSEWSLFLKLGNNNLVPHEIKVVELPYEYQMIFGKRYTIFKRSYLVIFNAKNIEGNSYITPDTHTIELYVRSAKKQHAFVWNLDEQKNLIG